MSARLTDAAVRRMPAAAAGKRVEKPDAHAPDLVLRINERGRKDWLVRCHLRGAQRKLPIGTWPGMGIP